MIVEAAIIYASRFEADVVSDACVQRMTGHWWEQRGHRLLPVLSEHASVFGHRGLGRVSEIRATPDGVVRAALGIERTGQMDAYQSVGVGGKTLVWHRDAAGVRVIDRFELMEVSLLSGIPDVQKGIYPIEFLNGTPAMTTAALAAIWAPVMGEDAARAYAEQQYGRFQAE